MLGAGHRAGAVAIVLGGGLLVDTVSSIAGHGAAVGSSELMLTATLAAVFTAGRFSPDCDNKGLIKRLFGHRYAVHWWGWPVIAMVLIGTLSQRTGHSAPLAAYGPALGWLIHIWPCDYLFGKRGRDIPKGIPVWPWHSSPRWGTNLRVTANNTKTSVALVGRRDHSTLEATVTVAFCVVIIAELAVLLSSPVPI